ncbi:SDR family oxidoreductase [Halalkalibacter akibai]|uniref:3-oxoacyl-[acyl-carrier protein] reductase n=1 Tax=Halalkalibacter akibai (strain ATCC 43226 / DSM 21942 / CIP 109018 / JCM 9157 / 1139) TaxID=1236973 RepID=W4QN88_HALA3|nr:SDR family oxidoreductase [Halalkalibacter akibai]GAE33372.1 3-oxoacyl-[acyl-carrier protein] reductase [Halalkalibacter akibai JCM 9157]
MNALSLFDLTGKTAIVTGGGRGLGRQIAHAFADAKANLVLCSRKLEACVEVCEELQEKGVKAIAIQCDVSNEDQVKAVVEQTIETFGKIDILVNNSGATWGAPAVDMPLEAWNKVLNVNVTGTFLMSKAVGTEMIKNGRGKIINIASVAGLGGVDPRFMDTIGYNTSKGAVITFTKDLASKWGKHGIHVNAIAPGFFPTKMSKGLIAHGEKFIKERTPLGRLGGEKDLQGAALFLASRASDYVTGDTLIVDGGMHAM